MEYRHNPDGSITEIPPTVLDCGHPYGPRKIIVGFEWHEASQRRVRCYHCRECGQITYWP